MNICNEQKYQRLAKIFRMKFEKNSFFSFAIALTDFLYNKIVSQNPTLLTSGLRQEIIQIIQKQKLGNLLFRMFGKAKIVLRVVYPDLKWNSCQRSICVFCACHSSKDQSRYMLLNGPKRTGTTPRRHLFEVDHKHDESVANRNWALAHMSIIYIVTQLVYSTAKHPKHSYVVEHFAHPRQTRDFSVAINWVLLFPPTRTVLVQVSLQNFPFLYSL